MILGSAFLLPRRISGLSEELEVGESSRSRRASSWPFWIQSGRLLVGLECSALKHNRQRWRVSDREERARQKKYHHHSTSASSRTCLAGESTPLPEGLTQRVNPENETCFIIPNMGIRLRIRCRRARDFVSLLLVDIVSLPLLASGGSVRRPGGSDMLPSRDVVA